MKNKGQGLAMYLNRYFKGEEMQILQTMFTVRVLGGQDYYYLRHGYGSWLRYKHPEMFFEILDKWQKGNFRQLTREAEEELQQRQKKDKNEL